MAIIKCYSYRKRGTGRNLQAKTETHANMFLRTIIAPGTSWCSINIC